MQISFEYFVRSPISSPFCLRRCSYGRVGGGYVVFCLQKDAPWVKKYKILILIVTNLAILAVGILLYENIFSLLPIAGVLLESAAGWMKNEKRIRIVSLFAVPCWLVYNIISRAYGSVIGSVLAFISIIVALIRYSKKKKPVQNCEVESFA